MGNARQLKKAETVLQDAGVEVRYRIVASTDIPQIVRQERDGWADRGGAPRWKPEEGIQGSVVFIGSISSQGIPGQIAYASTKAGLEGAEATLTKEAIFHGVHAAIVHPGSTNTPMVRVLGEEYIKKNIPALHGSAD